MGNSELFICLLKHFNIYKPISKYKIVCPFHDDKNASLQINVDQSYFYCYADCGAKGGPIELYKNFYKVLHPGDPHISDLKAMYEVNKIAKESGVAKELLWNANSGPSVHKDKDSILVARDYYYNLPEANWFKPRACMEVYEETLICRRYMNNRGFTNRTLTIAGAKPSLNKYYPIILPLLENEKFRGYVMRTFDPEIEKDRKYLYNKGFKRQLALPGRFGKKTGVNWVLVVEGYLDCLKAMQFGVPSVASFLGWRPSDEQLKKIQNSGINHIICGLDNDKSGRMGYNYLKNISEKYNFTIHKISYPKGIKDFGDLKKDTDQLNRVLSQIKKINNNYLQK